MERKLAIESHQNMVVLVGSGRNFKSALEPDINNFRPLSITAWTQTKNNDFMRLNEITKIEQTQREKELEEKVRILEETLKAQTDLLSQLFATSARTKILLGEQQPDQMQYNREEKPTNSFNSSDKTPEMSPNTSNSDKNSPINSVINPLKQIDSSPSDSVKYTIVTETYGNHNGEPIEIQLAEDDGAINFSSSANSEHLEICLTPEDNLDIKTETGINNSTRTRNISHSSTSSSEHHFTKKRKLTMAQPETLPSTSSNCIFNDQPNNSATDINPKKPKCNDLPKNKRARKNKNNNSNGSINGQTTSTSNTRRYPEPGIFEQSNASATGSHDDENSLVPIGPNSTRVPSELYNRLATMSASIATRKLLTFIFDRKTLATHTMTGKPSPAFKDQGKPVKKMLNPYATSDIIFAVTHKCKVSDKEVRNAITTKCADENKMYKAELSKRSPMEEINIENPVA